MQVRMGLALLAGLGLACLGGCVLPGPGPTTSYREPVPMTRELDSHMVRLDVALLERPLGDSFLNKDLWTYTDQLIVEIERQAVLEDNGFRVGQIVGMTPGRLLALLNSERSCLNGRRRLVPSGEMTTHQLGPVLAQASFQVKEGSQIKEITLDQGQCCLDILPTLTKDNRINLKFTPKVQHGQKIFPIRVANDYSGWEPDPEKPSKTFAHLTWQVDLSPGEFLLVGTNLAKPDSLGYRAFVQEEEIQPMQRVLVLRTSRSIQDQDGREPTLEEIARSSLSPPLALQAAMTSFRAASGH